MDQDAPIFWLTGMSGSGKTTLTNAIVKKLRNKGLNVLILDGDKVRESYETKLGFNEKDIEKNNLNISHYCSIERKGYDCIIVPIISPFDNVRKKVRNFLSKGFYLVYLSSTIDSLKIRDPKGLYHKADLGEINNLIGYSEILRYDIPNDYDLIIDTSNSIDKSDSISLFYNFINQKILDSEVT
jgi:adenylylsulfate kinase-like enzyme